MTTPSKQNKQKKSRKGSRKGIRGAKQMDLNVSAGRGGNIPRANMGRDTLLGLAQSQRRILSSVLAVASTSTAGAYNEPTTISLNNAFSLNGSGSAVGYAKYMAFYSKAWVLGARLHAKGAYTTTGTGIIAGVTITTNNTSLGTVFAAIENGMCDWTYGLNYPDRYEFRQAVDIAKFLNKPRILDDPQLYCTAAAGPTQLVVAHFWNAGQNSATFTANYIIEIELDVVFTDPIPFT